MSQYVVQPGDSWMSLAGRAYGNQRYFDQIMAANPKVSLMHPGDIIEIPDQVPPTPNPITYDQWSKLPSGYDPKTGQPIYPDMSQVPGYHPQGTTGTQTGTGTHTRDSGGNGGQGAPPANIPYSPQSVPSQGDQGVAGYIGAHQGTYYNPMGDRSGYDQGGRGGGPAYVPPSSVPMGYQGGQAPSNIGAPGHGAAPYPQAQANYNAGQDTWPVVPPPPEEDPEWLRRREELLRLYGQGY